MKTRIWPATLAVTMMLMGGCTPSEIDGDIPRRGPLGKADATGSCMADGRDFCGERSSGNCWCDDSCESYGDCCEDYRDSCLGENEYCTPEAFVSNIGNGPLVGFVEDDTHLYWATSADAVRRKPKAGGGAEIIVEWQYPNEMSVRPRFFAQNSTHVYFSDQGDGYTDIIYRVVKATGRLEGWLSVTGSIQALAANDEYLYWVNSHLTTNIRRQSIDRSDGGHVAGISTLGFDEEGLKLDEMHVYWGGSRVRRKLISQVPPTVETISDGSYPHSIVLDDSYVYWREEGEIKRRLKSGGRFETIVPRPSGDGALVLNGTHVYFRTNSTTAAPLLENSLYRVPKKGGSPVLLVDQLNKRTTSRTFAVDATHLYYHSNNVIWRVGKTCE